MAQLPHHEVNYSTLALGLDALTTAQVPEQPHSLGSPPRHTCSVYDANTPPRPPLAPAAGLLGQDQPLVPVLTGNGAWHGGLDPAMTALLESQSGLTNALRGFTETMSVRGSKDATFIPTTAKIIGRIPPSCEQLYGTTPDAKVHGTLSSSAASSIALTNDHLVSLTAITSWTNTLVTALGGAKVPNWLLGIAGGYAAFRAENPQALDGVTPHMQFQADTVVGDDQLSTDQSMLAVKHAAFWVSLPLSDPARKIGQPSDATLYQILMQAAKSSPQASKIIAAIPSHFGHLAFMALYMKSCGDPIRRAEALTKLILGLKIGGNVGDAKSPLQAAQFTLTILAQLKDIGAGTAQEPAACAALKTALRDWLLVFRPRTTADNIFSQTVSQATHDATVTSPHVLSNVIIAKHRSTYASSVQPTILLDEMHLRIEAKGHVPTKKTKGRTANERRVDFTEQVLVIGGGKSNVCFDFQNGKCKRGDACRFDHNMGAGGKRRSDAGAGGRHNTAGTRPAQVTTDLKSPTGYRCTDCGYVPKGHQCTHVGDGLCFWCYRRVSECQGKLKHSPRHNTGGCPDKLAGKPQTPHPERSLIWGGEETKQASALIIAAAASEQGGELTDGEEDDGLTDEGSAPGEGRSEVLTMEEWMSSDSDHDSSDSE
ncbi:MAG: zinc finger CCCH domain-containing protein [Gammaproteobacteria bacterium]|nr:zinc finger CCCH domain-containing protein [Gammaproteobacteria bacterium]